MSETYRPSPEEMSAAVDRMSDRQKADSISRERNLNKDVVETKAELGRQFRYDAKLGLLFSTDEDGVETIHSEDPKVQVELIDEQIAFEKLQFQDKVNQSHLDRLDEIKHRIQQRS